MKSKPKQRDEYDAFENLLKSVVRVPHSEIKAKLDEEKKAKIERKGKMKEKS